MLKSFSIFILSFVFLFLASCSTEVDNYADYKDVTIVYGLLETGLDTTFIKITKAYLGPGNALTIAQIPDSSNYPGKLDVKLRGKRSNIDLPEITLDTITIKNKLAGDSVFYFPEQKLYYTTANLDQTATYSLFIAKSELDITASAPLVHDFSVTLPVNRINFAATTASTIRWNSAVNGKLYEVQIVFHYDELYQGSTDTVHRTLTWGMGTKKSITTDGGEELEVTYLGEEFYTRLGQQIGNELNTKRWAGTTDIIISCAGKELSTFIDVNTPTNSIVQEVPEYTNIENGFGIFSSRKTAFRTYKLTVQSELKLVENYNWGFELKLTP